jgi:hypothetical protein
MFEILSANDPGKMTGKKSKGSFAKPYLPGSGDRGIPAELTPMKIQDHD